MKVNYFSILQKYIEPNGITYQFYVPHVVLVTQMALRIARRLNLNEEQQQFIEEASMLHDIGICKVKAPDIGCTGNEPYVKHGIFGREILESEGLPVHALVCERHSGLGFLQKDIEDQQLPLPKRDMTPVSVEEKIICYADKWYSKNPKKLWKAYSLDEILTSFARFPRAGENVALFKSWHEQFGE